MSKKGKRKFGDRKDGRRVRDIDGVHAVMPYLMPNRCDAEVYIEEDVDVTNLVKYLEEKNKGAAYKTTLFHIFVMAMGKLLYHRPLLNRFVAGRRTYQRNDITMSFVVKRKFKDEAEEMLMTLKIKDDTTLKDVSQKILGNVNELRKEDGGNDMGDFLDVLAKFPRFLMRFTKMMFFFLDFHGWVPRSVSDGDPNYSSVLLSNLGSIKCNPAYHHLNNYGTNSIVVTIGVLHKKQVPNEKGKLQMRDIISLGVTTDERIADGFYFSKSIIMLKELLARPELLDGPIKEVIKNVD